MLLSLLFPSSACFGFIFSSFSTFLRLELTILIWDFSSFLMYIISALNVPTGLAVSYKYWCALFTFHSVQFYFKISFETFSWPMYLFRSVLLSFQVCGRFIIFTDHTPMISVLLNLLIYVLWPRIWSILIHVCGYFKKQMGVLLLLCGVFR